MISLPFPIVVMTVSRPERYIQRTLEGLSPQHTVVLMAGSPDTAYLDDIQLSPRWLVVPTTAQEYAAIAGFDVHRRSAWNYWRCLRKVLGNDCALVLEDDVRCARGWETRLLTTIAALRAAMADFVLSLYYPYPKVEGVETCYLFYPKKRFYGTQAVLFAGRSLPEFTDYLYERGVREFSVPYDLVLQEFLIRQDIPLFATVPSLFQHIGVVTTGLAGKFHTTPWFVEAVEDWRP